MKYSSGRILRDVFGRNQGKVKGREEALIRKTSGEKLREGRREGVDKGRY